MMEFRGGLWSNASGPEYLPRMAPNSLLAWNVDPVELPNIPEHWLSFPAPHPMNNYLLGFLYVMFMIVACFGNGLVIWIFMTAKSLRTPSNILVVNLAICDFVMMCKAPIMVYNSLNLGFALGRWGCQIFALLGTYSGIGAAITNTCIAYDRYRTISDPMSGKLSKGKAFLMLILIYAYTLPWVLLPAMDIWGRFVPEGYLTTCSFDYITDSDNIRMFTGVIFFFSYVVPMSLIIYFYSQIVSHVVSHEKTLRDQAKKMNVESLRSNQSQQNQTAEIRIAKAAITICFMFVAAWTPYAVLALIGAFGNKSLITPGISMIPACACKLVACIDPYIYAISHPRYRLELQKRLPWLSGCIREPTPGENTSQNTENSATTQS